MQLQYKVPMYMLRDPIHNDRHRSKLCRHCACCRVLEERYAGNPDGWLIASGGILDRGSGSRRLCRRWPLLDARPKLSTRSVLEKWCSNAAIIGRSQRGERDCRVGGDCVCVGKSVRLEWCPGGVLGKRNADDAVSVFSGGSQRRRNAGERRVRGRVSARRRVLLKERSFAFGYGRTIHINRVRNCCGAALANRSRYTGPCT